MSLRDHPAFRGYDLANLSRHASTPEGCAFLEGHRLLIRAQRDRAKETADQLLANVEIADEILQRMSVVLDQGGEA